jgi:hypothetical protein
MTNAYMRIMEFPNGLSYREMALYASDETALTACKRRFSRAEPGERMTLLRDSGEFVFKLERPLAIGTAAWSKTKTAKQRDEC